MPAVLKSAIEKSYVDCGWDLMRSANRYSENIYPSFADVAKNIKEKDGDVITLSGSMFMLTKPEVIYLSSGNLIFLYKLKRWKKLIFSLSCHKNTTSYSCF